MSLTTTCKAFQHKQCSGLHKRSHGLPAAPCSCPCHAALQIDSDGFDVITCVACKTPKSVALFAPHAVRNRTSPICMKCYTERNRKSKRGGVTEEDFNFALSVTERNR
jgi:hypothetical protein